MKTTIQRLAPLLVAILVVASVATVGLAGSVTAQETDENDQPTVRVFHASPGAGAVDIYVDGALVIGNVGYGGYATTSLSPGDHAVTLTEAGNESNVVAESNVSVDPAINYTVVASGDVTANESRVAGNASGLLELTVFDSNVTAPEDDQTAVRLAHLSPDAGPVDVTVSETGDVVFDNVTFQNATEFVTLPAGNYSLDIRAATDTNDGEVVRTANLSFEGGTVASVFAIGYVAPSDGDERVAFRLLVLRDSGAAPVESDETGETPGETVTPSGPETPTGTATPSETVTPSEPTEMPAEPTETPSGTETASGTDTGTVTETPSESTP